jgi:hypothetical protein
MELLSDNNRAITRMFVISIIIIVNYADFYQENLYYGRNNFEISSAIHRAVFRTSSPGTEDVVQFGTL